MNSKLIFDMYLNQANASSDIYQLKKQIKSLKKSNAFMFFSMIFVGGTLINKINTLEHREKMLLTRLRTLEKQIDFGEDEMDYEDISEAL